VEALKKKMQQNNGMLKLKLNDSHVELTHGEDFFLSATEFLEKKQK